MQSLWSKTTELTKREILEEKEKQNFHIQNVVIGAGMAGILTAYYLQEKGQEVVILEAKGIASGQTKNTTAKITAQHGLIYADMIKKAGKTRAKGYAMANEEAIKKYEELIKKEDISCHFKKLPSFLYTTKEEETDKLKREAKAARELGIEADYMEGNRIEEQLQQTILYLQHIIRLLICRDSIF